MLLSSCSRKGISLVISSSVKEAAGRTFCILPPTVVRFGGIYGPGRNYFLNQVVTGKILRSSEPIYTNRIHLEDCAAVLYCNF